MTATSAGSVGPGTVLAGRYRLEDLLVESAGAWFWRATDTVLARSVAVHAVGTDDERAPGMLDAARLSATVNDPHLLRVLDCAEEGPVCWVVHEWGEGLSLDLMLERGPLAPTRAAWLAQEVADAIAAGHAQGVPHGRLNPEAVLVTHSGSVKLIGYVVDASLHHPRPADPVYGDLGPREADVIDVAGVLYAALTGRWPGVSTSTVPAAPLEAGRPLRPRQVRAGVPRALDAICERVLCREGSRHELPIEDAHELAAALADVTGRATPGRVALDTDPDDEATAVISRAALADEARRRAPETPETPESPGIPAATTSPATADDEATQVVPTRPATTAPDEATAVVPVLVSDRGDDSADVSGDNSGDRGSREDRDGRVDTDDLEATSAVTPAIAAPPEPERPVEQAPFHDAPERPLFSSDRRRVPAGAPTPAPAPWPASTSTGGTPPVETTGQVGGPGRGSGPDFWADERDAGPPRPTVDRHEGRGWLRTAVVVGLVLAAVIAMVAAFSLGRGGSLPFTGDDESPTPEQAAATPVRVQAVTDVDPPPAGNGEENPDTVGNAVDGDPATAWSTVTYYNRPDLGGLKPGVGLMLDLGSDQQVGALSVRFGQPGTSFEVYAAPEGVTAAPSGPDAMQQVASAGDAGQQATVDLEGAPTTRFVLLWLTSLPASPDGFRGEVAEVSLTS